MSSSTKLSVVCSLLDWMHRSKSPAKKRSKFRRFLDTFCSPDDYFSAIRLLLPALDRHRGSYGLKESALAGALVDALALSRDSGDARRLLQWRKDSSAANAGNFSLVATEVLARRQRSSAGDLTVGELNGLLDRLAAADSRQDKIAVIQALIARTNAREMKWILMIILKDLKLGISEKSIFHEFHPDAEDLFNVTCDLKLVCDKLRDRSQRHKRQDIEVGKAVRPQLATRVADATTAWKKLHGKEVVIECKLDGDRIQIHKNGTDINYFSRNFIDHSEYSHGMSDVIVQNVQADRCILDGEMLVWDTSLNRFAEFGSNQEIAKAAKDGFDSDRQLCYVAFDILYVGDTSIIHRSLKERHELLQKVVKPVKGRLEILIPNGGLNSNRSPGEPCCSLIAHSVDEVERFFKETVDNREEGIVLKDLGSKWEPSDRSGKWLKLKPDYVRAGSDLDVLIIGGYYGSGRRGGEIAQFLVGLAERPAPNAYPRRFLSFCRVGTGLSDEELDAVVNKLKPYFRKYEYPKKTPPSFYQVTNNSKERPDVWIDSPEKSIILAITSDIRTIRSEVFSAPYSLRFPRIDQVRYDKPWHECLDVQSFIELVQTSNGTTHRGKDSSGGQSKQKRTRSSAKEEKKNLSVVPSHMVRTDISGVKGDSFIFSGIMFYFVNVPPTHSLDSLHKIIAENGGTFSMNLNNSVTHCVAAESRGIRYQAAIRQGDVIHYSWVLDCCSQKKLLPLQPKYFLFLSDSSKKKLQEEIDEFSDSYYWDLDLADIKQLLSSIDKVEDAKVIDHYKQKYGPLKWSHFHGCSIYLHASFQSLKPDLEALFRLTQRRLKVEVKMNGGKVTESLSQATHLVVLWVPEFTVDLENALKSFTVREKRFLLKGMLHIVQSQWLEDSLERNLRLPEETYSLKPMLEQLKIEEDGKDDLDVKTSSSLDYGDRELAISIMPNKERSKASEESISRSLVAPKARKRGRPSGTKGKALANQTRRTRAHIRRKPSKISGHESNDSVSEGEEEKKLVKRGTRGRIREEKAAKLSSKDDSDNGSDRSEEKKCGKLEEDPSNALENERAEDFGSPKLENVKDVRRWFRKSPEVKMVETQIHEEDSNKALTHEKIEIMTDPDPVHAILLDMIPSLRKDKPELASASVSVKDADPKTKKKVSYKDLANQLLNDF